MHFFLIPNKCNDSGNHFMVDFNYLVFCNYYRMFLKKNHYILFFLILVVNGGFINCNVFVILKFYLGYRYVQVCKDICMY